MYQHDLVHARNSTCSSLAAWYNPCSLVVYCRNSQWRGGGRGGGEQWDKECLKDGKVVMFALRACSWNTWLTICNKLLLNIWTFPCLKLIHGWNLFLCWIITTSKQVWKLESGKEVFCLHLLVLLTNVTLSRFHPVVQVSKSKSQPLWSMLSLPKWVHQSHWCVESPSCINSTWLLLCALFVCPAYCRRY